MEREDQTTHQGGEHVRARELLEVLPARHALRVVADGELTEVRPDLWDELPDLSVSPERKRPLMRSYWAAVVEVTFRHHDPSRHPNLYGFVGTHLKNRTAVIKTAPDNLRIDFQVEDGGPASRAMVREFADQLQRVIGVEVQRVDSRVNDLDPALVDAVLREDPPNLRAL